MRCPLCQARPARRHCPALDRAICSVCCGTKRLAEIRCPDTCGYLANAQSHPPIVVARQQQSDMALVFPALEGLSEPEQRLFLLTLSLVDRHKGGGLGFDAATDADVAAAAEALAATYETSSKGLIYDHRPGSGPAQRLVDELRRAYDEIGREGPSSFLTSAARVLRRLATRVDEAHRAGVDGRTGFLEVCGRLAAHIHMPEAGPEPAGEATGGGLILP